MVKEGLSLVDIAVIVLKEVKEQMKLNDLFDAVIKRKELKVEDRADLMSRFYTDLTISAKFVYTGDNMWDLKANQKIELWEKDGSFFKEYKEVEIPEEYLEPPKPKVTKKPVTKTVVKEEPVVEEVVAVEEVTVEDKVEPVLEPVVATEPVVEEFEEELFEDEFDEDKYNEYMDKYEDQYEK